MKSALVIRDEWNVLFQEYIFNPDKVDRETLVKLAKKYIDALETEIYLLSGLSVLGDIKWEKK